MKRLLFLTLSTLCAASFAQLPDYVPTEGLVALYQFDGNPHDSSGNENHGVNSGATLTHDRHGNENSAYSFAGNCNDRVNAYIPVMAENQQFSVAFWAQRNGGGCGNPRMFEFWGGTRTMQGSWFNAWSYITFSGFPIVDVDLETEAWYHFALVNDGSEWKSYVNGTLNNVESNPDIVNSPDLAIGRMNHPGWDSFNGDIDEFAVWNRALTIGEIQGLFDATLPSEGCTDSTACNYDASANIDNGTCASCETLATACGVGTTWDAESGTCIVANPSDSNFDGCVQLTDLLDLLSAYGTCGDCGGDCSLANASSTCVDNECTIGQCNEGYANCNELDEDGCEVDLLTDPNHCGGCGIVCDLANASSTCMDGECVIESCNDGFADYNGEALDGCESEEVPPWSCGEDLVFEGHAYATVQINGQCWFAENLRNTSYANGDAIAGNLNDAAWSTTSSGGRATFGEGASVCYGPAPGGDACNEAFSLTSYGRLYNWHAVNDARGLCPSGWHVPSDGEWTTLTDGIGGALTGGNTLKAGFGWFNNGNGSSPNGFDAFPGGQRMNAGNFQGAGTDAFFWTSTALSSVQVWFRSMGWNLPEVVRNPAEKNVGMSIRCIKDTE